MQSRRRPLLKTIQTSVITNSIRRFYQKRLFLPAFYLLFLTVVWFAAPISQLVLPHQLSSEVPFRELRNNRSRYIQTTLTNLRFTGYIQKVLGYTNGYYYYTFQDGQCIFVLLAPATCKKGSPDIERLQVRVHVIRHFEEYDTLTHMLAEDLNWTASGIRSRAPDYLLSEPGFHKFLSLLLLGFYFASGAYALANIFMSAICILFPIFAPACQRLRLYGSPKKLLLQAEKELVSCFTQKQVSSEEKMFLTTDFFLLLSENQIVIMPVREIIEAYKRSTLHKFFWHPSFISHTLLITAKRHVHIQCKNMKESDIDRMIHALQASKHQIPISFHEKKRQ